MTALFVHLFAFFLLFAANAEAASVWLTGEATAYDGDSLTFAGVGDNAPVEVRLQGLDAPELRQACQDRKGEFWRCGEASRRLLQRMILDRKVRCKILGRERAYNRPLGYCFAGGKNLNQSVVSAGLARAYTEYDVTFLPQEEAAQKKRRGMWAAANADPFFCRHPDALEREKKKRNKDLAECYLYDDEGRVKRAAELKPGK